MMLLKQDMHCNPKRFWMRNVSTFFSTRKLFFPSKDTLYVNMNRGVHVKPIKINTHVESNKSMDVVLVFAAHV